MGKVKVEIVVEGLRLVMAGVFLWVFVDKLLGLGFSTSSERAWVVGMSPTRGFLEHGTSGPLGEVFKGMVGNPVVDGLFMVGVLGVGLSLLTGMGLKVARISGVLLMLLIYLAAFPPDNNPILDEHIVYMQVIVLVTSEGQWFRFSLRDWWKSRRLVKQFGWLD
jgi:thiosulfate dehydrogenase [quinone] large subunit